MRNKILTSSISDVMVWNSFKNGDKAAFATLYYRYFGILLNNCFRYSKDTRIIEDCIHDLFLEIWNNKLNLVTPTCVKAYLLCSTQRKVLRQIKKNRSCTTTHANSTLLIENTRSIEEKIISEQLVLENKGRISDAIKKLTIRQQQAISLRYFNNHSYGDIAKMMEISVDAVYNLVSKALNSIQKDLQGKAISTSTCLN